MKRYPVPGSLFLKTSMATFVARPVTTKKRADDIYFITMSVVMLAIVVVGFGPTYFYRGAVLAPLPSPLVHIHGAAFTSWIVLFIVQNLLISSRNVRLHRKLGYAGAVLAACMVVLGVLVDTAAIRRGGVPPIFTAPQFILINDLGVALFGSLVAAAVWQRRNGPVHKRLMLIATIGIMPPAITRYAILVHQPLIAPAVLYTLLLSVIVFDMATRKKPYAVTILASLATIAVFPLSKALSYTPFMQHLASRIQGHP
jgi:hypothetical protein